MASEAFCYLEALAGQRSFLKTVSQQSEKSVPACQWLSLWGQRQRPPPVAETGSRCWGRGQQDASESEADAGSRNPGSVTEGDGEGKPVTKRLLTQRWAGSLSERCYRNMAASLSASLPSQALRASSPKGRALGISVKFPLDEQSLSVSWTVVPCCPGQRQLDKVRCPEAAALCSKARPFAPYCATGVQ